MAIITKLSSQIGDKTEEGNRLVAKECLQLPSLLAEIAEGLASDEKALVGDCAEVFTKVGEEEPKLLLPYMEQLMPLINNKTTRIRWEAMHAISIAAIYLPEKITILLPKLQEIMEKDKSTIVRDYAIETMCNYANAGQAECHAAFPILKKSLHIWEGKHRARALKGFLNICKSTSEYTLEIRGMAEEYVEDSRGVVKKAAKSLIKAIDKGMV